MYMNTSKKYSNIHVHKYILNWRLKLNVGNTKVVYFVKSLEKKKLYHYIGIEVLNLFCHHVKKGVMWSPWERQTYSNVIQSSHIDSCNWI